MPFHMRKIALLLACLTCAGHARRMQVSTQSLSAQGEKPESETPPEHKESFVEKVEEAVEKKVEAAEKNLEKVEEAVEKKVEKAEEAVEKKVDAAEKKLENVEEAVENKVEKEEETAKKKNQPAEEKVEEVSDERAWAEAPDPAPREAAPAPASADDAAGSSDKGTLMQLWENKNIQRVLMLLLLVFFGKVLQARFPGNQADVIQKMLLQFLAPATIFKGLSGEKIGLQHAVYIAGGVGLVLARAVASALVAYATLGSLPKHRRTAFFQISTQASALSVLPFLSEFLEPHYVGLGGIVDLPMKVYMLLVMPMLLKKFGEGMSAESASNGKSGGPNIIKQLLTDPITLSLILGVAMATASGGAGTKILGFAGQTIDSLAGALTPSLFLLIGLKLKFESTTPLYCITLLMAAQGVLLLIVSLALLIFQPSDDLAKFIIIFAQGSPGFVGLAAILNAVNNGVTGYIPGFAFDIVSMAFPISSFVQCFAGVMGPSYLHGGLPFLGITLVVFAGLLRLLFRSKFVEDPEKPPVTSGN